LNNGGSRPTLQNYFIECAIKQKAKLLTLDNKLKAIAEKLNIKTIEVTS